ncbi:MAG: hypothetical protein CMK89_08205 [Pseudomonadales bacterium]|nr:hypothetical protein [Pseudomonadales bacterium]
MPQKSDQFYALCPIGTPITGRQVVSTKVCEIVEERKKHIRIFDYSPNHNPTLNLTRKFCGIVRKVASAFLISTSIRNQENSQSKTELYIALNDGLALWIDYFVIILTKSKTNRTILHHHSRRYIDKRSMAFSLISKQTYSANITHIFQCKELAKQAEQLYPNLSGQHLAISNAFTVKPQKYDTTKNNSVFTIGFISNLTIEKGLDKFFEVACHAKRLNLDWFFVLAGPADKPAEALINGFANESNIKYLGPVYGDKKELFFRDIDALLFPTSYPAETEGIVVLEAISHGCVVASTKLPCCVPQLRNNSVLAEIPGDQENWHEEAIVRLNELRALPNRSKLATDVFNAAYQHSTRSIIDLIETEQ